DEATAAIDKAKRVTQKVKHESVNLEVLKHDGSGTVTIKGIHQRHGNLLFTDGNYSKEASETYSRIEEVYPVAAWITRLLQERATLRKRLGEIDTELRAVKIKIRRSYGAIKSPEQYDREVAGLRAEHERVTHIARKKAEKPETLANTGVNTADLAMGIDTQP